MCGIAGAASASGIDPRDLVAMGDAIRHRGPDGEGYTLLSAQRGLRRLDRSEIDAESGGPPASAGFAHRRLSIIDLSEASDQPLHDPAGELAIAYNGELYNYVELREELEGAGREFRTTGDTEVVLGAYAEWGPACLERMVGMWALAILDLRTQSIFLAVDRFGIKPLFYTLAGDAIYFASEIKALAAVPSVELAPNEAAVRKFLFSARVDERDQTFFAGVRRLPPAHHLTIPIGRPDSMPEPRRYWDYPPQSFSGSRRKAAAEFAERFEESVRVHLRSDVPVGTCLSGGLDSSGIVCMADKLRREGKVPHYSHQGFGYLPDDPKVSERGFMEEVVRKTGIEMTYVQPSHEAFSSALLDIVAHQDEPFGTTSIAAQWFVFEAAHEAELKVMLDGQGADEVLGGYHSYFPSIGISHLKARRALAYANLNRKYRRLSGSSIMSRRHAIGYLRRPELLGAGDGAPPAPPGLPEGPASPLVSEQLKSAYVPEDWVLPHPDSINELLEAQTAYHGLPALLRFEDRNSMAHSIEARVPFLDHRLVEFAFSLPGDYKIKGIDTKHVLREALKGVLPEPIRARKDKIGFRAEPTATWELAERNRDALLANRTPWEERWFERSGVDALLGGADRADLAEHMLWRVISLKLWLRSFWGEDGDPLAA